MTLLEIQNRWPVAYRAWQLTNEGNDRRAVGKLMGLSRHTVSSHVNRVRKSMATVERQAAKRHPLDSLGARCHCGLLPPHVCLAPIWYVAASRNGESAGLF